MPCVLAVLLGSSPHPPLSVSLFLFHLYIFLLRYWPLLLLLLLLAVAAALLPLPLLLLLLVGPHLPVLHITTGFLPMLKIDQRQVRSQ